MKRTSQSSMLSFFKRKTNNCDENNSKDNHEKCSENEEMEPEHQNCDNEEPQMNVPSLEETHSTDVIDQFDIGLFVNKQCIDDDVKLRVIKNPWVPPPSFKFPTSLNENKKYSFQPHWLQQHQWLSYSRALQGGLCKFCILFSRKVGGVNDQKLGKLVRLPLTKYKDAKEELRRHEGNKYHKEAVIAAENFVSIMEGNTQDVSIKLTKERQRIALENKEKLAAIVETIVLCGRQELALRGSDDFGPVGLEEPLHNDGNLRAFLRYRARSDEVLKKHLSENGNTRAMYTSPAIQNEIIDLCGQIIQEDIARRVSAAECFSVLADETQDVSRTEQLSICVRYLDSSEGKSIVREDFLAYVPVHDVKAEALASTIMSSLEEQGLDLNKMVGQGYDGAAVMSGRLRGVRTIISQKYPKAQFVHCAAHSLNLVIAKSCEIRMVKNCVGTVKSVVNFINQSFQRNTVFEAASKDCNSSHFQLIKLCETRWTEKHKSVQRFVELFVPVTQALGNMENLSTDTSQQAYQLLQCVSSGNFIITLLVLNKVFAYSSRLCQALQQVNTDLVECCEHVKLVVQSLQDLRNGDHFTSIFNEAEKLALEIGEEIKKPRLTGRQTMRGNVNCESAIEYFRLNLFLPFLDFFISELNARFTAHNSTIARLQHLIPSKSQVSPDFLKSTAQLLIPEVNFSGVVGPELHMWRSKWALVGKDFRPSNAFEALDACDATFFPTIRTLLSVLATLPVSTATAERSFSTLKRLKTWLRNSMGDSRLTGLALLSVHRRVHIDSKEVVARLASKRKRLNLIL